MERTGRDSLHEGVSVVEPPTSKCPQDTFTQDQVKEKLGYSRNTIHRWERGIGSPKLTDLVKLCALYGVPIECIKT